MNHNGTIYFSATLINFIFEEINVPTDKSAPYIFGQRSTDSHWLVYDLKQEQFLMDDVDYNKVIDVWLFLDLDQLVYVNAHNTLELLTETRDSVVDIQLIFINGF